MAKKMLIDATHAEETRVVVVDGNKVEEFDFESQARRQLAGNIYLAKVTRVEPSLQAAFVDYGGNRHGFLAFSEIHPDYYQIPVADREALLAEERAYAESLKADDDEDEQPSKKVSRSRRGRGRSKTKAAEVSSAHNDTVATAEVELPEEELSGDIKGMEVLDLDTDEDGDTDLGPVVEEGRSPMETVAETPIETPEAGDESEEDDDDDGIVGLVEVDETIESVADEDDTEEVRPARKPRPKRYKIQEVIKVRQILLVQVVKEERGNKGAALTTYLSLAGRYCVLMPNTARGGGISRKITNAADRKKLKEIASKMDVPEGAGLIIRTAGAQRTKAEIKRDYEYLQRMWEQIRELTLKSTAPAKIYEEGDLIKRTIRDLYSKEIDEVIVAGEQGYRNAKDFMKMIMPSHAKNVKNYTEQLPLYARYQVEGYLGGMFNPTVQLPSGGYIVIGVTEALVAIDVNSGKATKEGSIEQTALKTNLEAAEEVARQLRLRDLAGLIVIDFIDMDERKNNSAVEKRLKEKLKTDRARIQVGRISGFGLLEMSRQRLRPGMLEATTQPCPHCHGTGLLRSDDNTALAILRQLEEEGVRGRSREVLVRAPIGIANFMMNQKREHVADIEARYGMAVRVEADPSLVSPEFALEKFKTATRIVPEAAPVITSATAIMEEVEEDLEDEIASTENEESLEEKPKKKRRRRRRRRGGGNREDSGVENSTDEQDQDLNNEDGASTVPVSVEADEGVAAAEDEKPKKRRTRRKKADTAADETDAANTEVAPEPGPVEDAVSTEAEEKPKKRTRTRKKKEPEIAAADDALSDTPVEVPAEAEEKPKKRTRARKKAEPTAEETPTSETVTSDAIVSSETPEPAETAAPPTPEVAQPVPAEPLVAEPAPEPEVAKPKRRGWWSVGR